MSKLYVTYKYNRYDKKNTIIKVIYNINKTYAKYMFYFNM